jgi:hypothetical protein
MDSKDKSDTRTLRDSPAAVPTDTRPRFLWISTPAGTLRIRRMSPPQLFTQIKNFSGLGILSEAGEWKDATTAPQMMELSKFIQRCIVKEDSDCLAFPGRRGLQTVQTWSADRRRQIAKTAADFMEV